MFKGVCCGPKVQKDQGYAWVVLVSAFFTLSLTTGFILSTAGNLNIAHKEFFNVSLQESSSIGSVCTGTFFVFGPVASVIVKYTKSRPLQVFGGCCVILGLGLSALSREAWHAYLLYSVITAIGASCSFISTSRILHIYFEKRKHLAFSVAGLGTYLGSITWPLVSGYLLDIMGYSRTMGMLASAHTALVMAGMSYRENSCSDETELPGTENTDAEAKQEETTADSNSNYINAAFSSDGEKLDVEVSEKMSQSAEEEKSPQNEIEPQETPELADEIKTLLQSPKTWILFINFLLWQGNTSSFLILVNNYILERTGATTEEIALGITILGVGSFMGCSGVISISGRKFDRTIIHFCCPLLFGIVTIATTFVTNKQIFYTCTVIWGMGLGSTIGNMMSVIHSLGEPHQFTLLLGVAFFGQGIGGLSATPLIGVISQASIDQIGLIFSGLLGICSSLIILPLVIFNARKQSSTLAESTLEEEFDEGTKL